MDDVRVKVALYGFIAETGRVPAPTEVAERLGMDVPRVLSEGLSAADFAMISS